MKNNTSTTPKRPRDRNQLAHSIVAQVIAKSEKPQQADSAKQKAGEGKAEK